MGIVNQKQVVAILGLLVSQTTRAISFRHHPPAAFLTVRGGESSTLDEAETSLDDKVEAAMKKLGISSPEDDENCKDGVCTVPGQTAAEEADVDPNELADEIAKDMNVDSRLAMAAIGATRDAAANKYNPAAARAMIQSELDLISGIPPDSSNVKALETEGFDSFLSRRALAFADNNMDDARAILLADQMDEEEEEEQYAREQLRREAEAKKQETPDIVEVKADFDPTTLSTAPKVAAPSAAAQSPSQEMPKPANKQDVVFEANSPQDVQQLVLESPVPVLLDVYADWCGPCKALTPALEDMAIKAGGVFRLVKVNTDTNKAVSGCLKVTSLPTVFGVRDGKIVHMFQGMPRSEEMMKNFMLGLFGAAPFKPAVTAEETVKYQELTMALIKTAGAASFSFSARERLTDRIETRLDQLVTSGEVDDVEASALLMRTLFNNLVKNPFEEKFRSINLENKVINSKIGNSKTCLAVLKSVGFAGGDKKLVIGKGKKLVNVAPLQVARDTIDNWIQKNQREMVAAARKQKDELDRANLKLEDDEEEDEEDEEDESKVDPTVCSLKLRLDGKNKVHQVTLHKDDPLSRVLDALDLTDEQKEIQITCVAKRLVVKSSNAEAMQKTLAQHGLMPSAAIVVKVGSTAAASSASIKERAANKVKNKKGSHTMQSIGIYAKDDNNKAELIDGGGGVWYEHDISDDEEEEAAVEEEAKEEEEIEAADKQENEE